MSLTGWPLLVLVVVLAIVLTVSAIAGFPRRWPRLVQRVLTVLGAQLAATLVVLISLNNWGEFYGSWSDLMGAGSYDVTTISPSAQSVAEGVPASMSLTGWSHKDELSTRGGIFSMNIAGRESHLSSQALIFLPPEYFQPQRKNERFPVVETFTGYPGNVPQLVNRLGYPDAEEKAVRSGRARPMILVMMRPTLVPPRDTECTDIPGGPKVLTFFRQDVPATVKKNLRTTATAWGTMGHSTGGYCAAKLAMLEPNQFTAAVSLSGYFTPHEDATTGELFGQQQRVQHENDLIWRLKHKPVPGVFVLASVGQDEQGDEGLEQNRAFLNAVRPPMVAQLKMVSGGGHNFRTYQAMLPEAFGWLSTHMSH